MSESPNPVEIVAEPSVEDKVESVPRPPFVWHDAEFGPYACKQQCFECFAYYSKAYASLSSFNYCGGETCAKIDG